MVPNGRQTSQNEKARKPELTAIKEKFKIYGVPTEVAYKVASKLYCRYNSFAIIRVENSSS